MAAISPETRRELSGLSAGNIEVLEQTVGLRELNRAGSGLDARTFALVKLAALIALDAPSASYGWQIANAIEEGVTAEEFLGVLKAVAPQVGGPKVIAAAPEIMLAMGLATDEAGD
jgi:4-carboxymuconolactone decarboxylase